MKILFITDLYPVKSDESTTPKTLHNFVFEWIKQGHIVDVIKPNFILNSFLRKKPFYKTGFYEYDGVKVFNANYLTPFLFDITKKLSQEDKRCRGVEAWQNDTSTHPRIHASEDSSSTFDYDVIIAHMPSGIIFANKLAKKFDKPLVCGVHCSDIQVLTNPIYNFYFSAQLKDAYKNAKKIACRSFVLKEKFNKLLPEFADKTFVAMSGIENNLSLREASMASDEAIQKDTTANAFRLPRHELKSLPRNDGSIEANSPMKVLTCANLIKRKNIDKLILAINDLEGFELKIIGDGKELNRLKSLALRLLREKVAESQMMGNNKITFLGRLPHKKVLEEMRKADIFILPSVDETFGMVYLEAMASGCITVCTKNDGIDGIIKNGENGFLTEPTVEGIQRTLLRIQNHPNLKQIIKNNFETVKEYSSQNCAKNYMEFIKL